MADKNKPGLLDTMRRRMAAEADALKAGAASALKDAAAGMRKTLGPERTKPVKQPERPFGRDGGGDDVMRVVWTGHTTQGRDGKSYFGAVGLTEGGYYRAAKVQRFGADELWNWHEESHTAKNAAIKSAESLGETRPGAGSGDRGRPAPDVVSASASGAAPKSKQRGKPVMAEIPENVKEQAVKAREESRMLQMKPDQEIASAQPVDNYGDRGKEMAAMQEQKREAARQENEAARQEKNQPERE